MKLFVLILGGILYVLAIWWMAGLQFTNIGSHTFIFFHGGSVVGFCLFYKGGGDCGLNPNLSQ